MKTPRQALVDLAEWVTLFGETIWQHRLYVVAGFVVCVAVVAWVASLVTVAQTNIGAALLMLATPLVIFSISASRLL